MIEMKNIHGMSVAIADSHNEALIPWSEYRKKTNNAPILLTMDYHTDLCRPFRRKVSEITRGNCDDTIFERFISQVNFSDMQSIINAVDNLNHDEHIMTAIRADIIKEAFVIAYNQYVNQPKSMEEIEEDTFYNEYGCLVPLLKLKQDNGEMTDIELPSPPDHVHPYHYEYPEDRVFAPAWSSLQQNRFNDKECMLDYVIDDCFLFPMFSTFYEMIPERFNKIGAFTAEYILDIDSDYFSSEKSLRPQNSQFFYNLIRSAKLITIAKEPECVKFCSQNRLTYDIVLEAIISHIEKAIYN